MGFDVLGDLTLGEAGAALAAVATEAAASDVAVYQAEASDE